MSMELDIAHIASLLGDKTRASMLVALMNGQALTASELSFIANASAQTVSNHLLKLQHARLISCEPAGRHRYYRLANHHIAETLESLSLLSKPPKQRPPHHQKLDHELCFARSCYQHLAGELGVEICRLMQDKQLIIKKDQQFELTAAGQHFFTKLDIDWQRLQSARRQFAKACLDWTEREHHLGGSLGQALLSYLLEQRLVLRSKSKQRVLLLTSKGQQWLKQI